MCEEGGSLATAGRPGEEGESKEREKEGEIFAGNYYSSNYHEGINRVGLVRLWMQPPSLLSLTIDSAVLHISHITDLSAVPDPILVELFLKTLRAGKLTEKILKLFTATGNEEILCFVQSLNIKQVLTPVLPTRCSEKF